MGITTGKLTLPAVTDKLNSESKIETVRIQPIKETASQLVNGDANAVCNVPPIDEVVDEPDTVETKTEAQSSEKGLGDDAPAVVETLHEPNGTVSPSPSPATTEGGLAKKKNKNPIIWLKRRLSKKTSNAKPPTEDAKPEEVSAAANEGKINETVVLDTANSLVEEVLSMAVAYEAEAELQHRTEQPEMSTLDSQLADVPHPEMIHLKVNEADQSVVSQDLTSNIILEETGLIENNVNGHHNEDHTEVDEHIAEDSNNTNVYNETEIVIHESKLNAQIPVHDDSLVSAKLLLDKELTNGHAIHSLLENGDVHIETTPTEEAVVNGD